MQIETQPSFLKTGKIPQRKLVFISHASPEDNEFARWLAVKLTAAGYTVWADVEQLIGGEKFWNDIADAILNYAAVVLFCGTEKAVRKAGVLREFELTRTAEKNTGLDILVPLRLDKMPYQNFPGGIFTDVNIIPFTHSWAEGFSRVLAVLKRKNVPTRTEGHTAVANWWRKRFAADEGVTAIPEIHLSNIFAITGFPGSIHYYPCRRPLPEKFDYSALPFAARPFGEGVLTCESEANVVEKLQRFGPQLDNSLPLSEFALKGWKDFEIYPDEAQKRLYWMLRFAFGLLAKSREMKSYTMSGQNVCYLLESGKTRNDEYLVRPDQKPMRQLVGYQSYGAKKDGVRSKRLWHFAVQPKPVFEPFTGLILKTHVVFSEDGKKLIESSDQQHSARRSACKTWWNPVWRDRLLATVTFISGGTGTFFLPLSTTVQVPCSISPLELESPRSYSVSEKQPVEKVPDYEDYEPETGADADE